MYPYTADLLCLGFNHPVQDVTWGAITTVATQLQPDAWENALRTHPDRAFGRFVVEGLCQGFRIGFNRQTPLQPALRNMQSALDHPEVIDNYLRKECTLGSMLGPIIPEVLAMLSESQINRFGVIPKGHNTGKWRLISDLSYPPGRSVKDGIVPDLCSLSYVSVTRWPR